MKCLILLICFLIGSFSLSACEEDEIILTIKHSLRIPNQTIEIVNIPEKPLKVMIRHKNMKPIFFEKKISALQDKSILKLLNEYDPKIAMKDSVIGLDGSIWTLKAKGYTVKVWSPNYDIKTRSLTKFYDLCRKLLELGGLDNDGLSKEGKKNYN